jgi:hypothetical protein
MLLIGCKGRGRERYLKRIMKNLASERAGKLIGLSGVMLHMWFRISFGEYRWIWGHARHRASKKK